MRTPPFVSWLSQMLAGLALLVGGLETAWIFRDGLLSIAIGGFAVAVLGLLVLSHAEARERPRRVLRKAQRSVELAPGWGVEFNKAVPGAGIAAIVVTRSDSTRFVIDVKAYKDASTKREVTGREQGTLIGANGKEFRPDPLPPLAKLAQELGATPVLWLPEATANRSLRLLGSNLIVVMGSARHLKHALLGAEVDSPRQRRVVDAKPAKELASSEAR